MKYIPLLISLLLFTTNFLQAQKIKKFDFGIGIRLDQIQYEPSNKVAFNNPRLKILDSYGVGFQTILKYHLNKNLGLQFSPSINYKETIFELNEIGNISGGLGNRGFMKSDFYSFESDILLRYSIPHEILSFNFSAGLNIGILGRSNLVRLQTGPEFGDGRNVINFLFGSESGIETYFPTGGFIFEAGVGLFKNRIDLFMRYHYNLGNYNRVLDTDREKFTFFIDDNTVFQGKAHRLSLGVNCKLFSF